MRQITEGSSEISGQIPASSLLAGIITSPTLYKLVVRIKCKVLSTVLSIEEV